MQFTLLSASFSGIIIIVWIMVAVISAISNSKKKRQMQQPYRQPQNMNYPNPNQPNYGYPQGQAQPFTRFSSVNQMQWDQQKIRQQTEHFAEDNRMSEADYAAEEEFRRQTYTFRQEVPNEVVHEYVPEEFGESNASMENDRFYASAEIQNALQDEQDLAREKAYRRKTTDAFSQTAKPIRSNKLFDGRKSLKRAILLSEVLGEPKSLR